MDVNELLKLERPLTAEETAFVEREVLKLARELHGHIDTVTKHLDPADPDVARLRASAPTGHRHRAHANG